MKSRVAASVAGLSVVTAIWGLTFVMIKQAITEVPPLQFLALRFTIAASLLAVAFPKRITPMSAALRPGILAGLALAAGYGLQTFGLKFIGATESGFITGLNVVFTPLIAGFCRGRWPRPLATASVTAAFAGLLLLIPDGNAFAFGLDIGEALTIGCAISFAIHIVVLTRYARHHDARTLALVQMFTCAAIFAGLSILTERWSAPTTEVWLALTVTSVGASAGAFFVMTWATQVLTETETAVTLTLEPVFAGIAGAILLEERLSARGWLGVALILAAMVSVNLRSR